MPKARKHRPSQDERPLTHWCGYCGRGARQITRPRLRNLPVERVLPDVRRIVLATRNVHVEKEEIAWRLRVRVGIVEQCLQKLNLEGLVGRPVHSAPHDTRREINGYCNKPGWDADRYPVTRKARGETTKGVI